MKMQTQRTWSSSASGSTSEPVKLMPWPAASQCLSRSDPGVLEAVPRSCQLRLTHISLPVLSLQSLPITGRSCVASIQPPKPMQRRSASEYRPTACPGLPFLAQTLDCRNLWTGAQPVVHAVCEPLPWGVPSLEPTSRPPLP